jgi:hypothetical protein
MYVCMYSIVSYLAAPCVCVCLNTHHFQAHTKPMFCFAVLLQLIEHLIKRFDMKYCKPKPTPMTLGLHLNKDDCPDTLDKEQTCAYQQLIGSLMYVACGTLPDIVYAVSTCAQFISNPGPCHMEAAKHIVRYLKGASHVEQANTSAC